MKEEKRFDVIYTQCNSTEIVSILLDKKTGKQFIMIDTDRGIAITPIEE